MYKENILLILLISLVFFQASSSAPASQRRQLDLERVSLTELGTSQGVTYYVGHEEIPREAGEALCRFNNLTLAEVHSPEQEQFLQQALTELNEFSHYSTGGKTRIGVDSLVWETSNSGLHELSAVSVDIQEQRCLYIRVPDYKTLWEIDPCSDNWPPICQSQPK